MVSTKGNKSDFLFSQQLAQKHFIAGGNKSTDFLATDGKFRFNEKDFGNYGLSASRIKKITMSVVAFWR